jgi:Universal stress protein UspA and related nucleotide-binding proteins
MKMKIVVGVDGSQQANRAVEWCADHAGALDAEVVAVHAIDIPFYVSPTTATLPNPPLSPEDRAELLEHVTTVWCAPLAKATVPFRVVLRDSDPALAIMQVAKTEQADLVVAGRRGRGGFAELVLGSTTYALTHHLDRPLVIVP